jgi:hypothetical protein
MQVKKSRLLSESNCGNMLKGLAILLNKRLTTHKNQSNTHFNLNMLHAVNDATRFRQMGMAIFRMGMGMGTILHGNTHHIRLHIPINTHTNILIPTAVAVFPIDTVLLRDINLHIASIHIMIEVLIILMLLVLYQVMIWTHMIGLDTNISCGPVLTIILHAFMHR